MIIDKLKLMSGVPIALHELGLSINQPKLKDIALMGEADFFKNISYFLVSKTKLNIPIEVSDFDLFMYFINQDESLQASISDIFILIIDGLESIKFYDSFIIVNALGHECIIDEPKFLIIKETLIQIFCLESQGKTSDLNPANKLAQEIADKLKKRQQQLSAESPKQQSDIFSDLISILSIGTNALSIEDCLNLTVFQIYNLIKRFTMYQEHNRQIQALIQGAKDIELVEWTKQI
jgi:hypothetical protein